MATRRDDEEQDGRPSKKRRLSTDDTTDKGLQESRGHRYASTVVRGQAHAHFGDTIHNYYHDTQNKTKLDLLLTSLAFTRMDSRLRNVAAASPTTCDWLFGDERFKSWADDASFAEHHGFFWIKGKPGSGKSTIMKRALTWVGKNWPDRRTISYFFNARSLDELEKSTLGLYRSLVHQIISTASEAQLLFLQTFGMKESDGQVDQWTENELENFLIDLVTDNRLKSFVIFIDALDEGYDDDVQRLVIFFNQLVSRATLSKSCFRVCFSSRHYPHIQVDRGLSLIVERESGHQNDIDIYISNTLPRDDGPRMQQLRLQIRERSQGIFLWVVIVVPMLCQVYNQGKGVTAMIKKLEGVPRDLRALFSAILSRDLEDFEDCIKLLQWVLVCREPLRSNALYAAIKQLSDTRNMDIDLPSPDMQQKYILNTSRGLVELQFEEDVNEDQPSLVVGSECIPTVQFIHQSVRDYLLSIDDIEKSTQPSILSKDMLSKEPFRADLSHIHVAHDCLRYLLHLPDLPPSEDAVVERYPVATYAAKHWWHHLRMSDVAGDHRLYDEAATLLTQSPIRLLTWVQLYQIDAQFPGLDTSITTYDLCHPLYYAAMTGLVNLVRHLVRKGCLYLGEERGRFGSALQAACFHGDHEVVVALLEAGANPGTMTQRFDSAFQAALENNQLDMLRPLIEHSDSKILQNELVKVSLKGVSANVEALLKSGLDRSLVQKSSVEILQAAVRSGSVEIFRMLDEAGADLARTTHNQKHAIFKSLIGKNTDTMNLLLTTTYRYLVLELFEISSVEFVDLFVSAIRAQNFSVVQFFLNSGMSLNSRLLPKPTEPALIEATETGSTEMVRVLIKAGADLNEKGSWKVDNRTALIIASATSYVDIVKLLIDSGASTTMRGSDGQSAIEVAMENKRPANVRCLLGEGSQNHNAKVDSQDLLRMAIRRKDTEYMRWFFNTGFDIDIDDPEVWAIFTEAVKHGTIDLVRPFLPAAVKHLTTVSGISDSKSLFLHEIMHTAAKHDDADVIKLLLQHGVSIDLVLTCYPYGSGRVLWAAFLYHAVKVSKILLQAGARDNVDELKWVMQLRCGDDIRGTKRVILADILSRY